jgi:hypothetical protein
VCAEIDIDMTLATSWMTVFSDENKENIPYAAQIEQRALDLLQRVEFDEECMEFAKFYIDIMDFPMMWISVHEPVERRWDAYMTILHDLSRL